MKILADQLRTDLAAAPLKCIPAAVHEVIQRLDRAETQSEQVDLLRALQRYIEDKITEAMRQL